MIVLAEFRLTNCVHIVNYNGGFSNLLIGRHSGGWVWTSLLHIIVLPQQMFLQSTKILFYQRLCDIISMA